MNNVNGIIEKLSNTAKNFKNEYSSYINSTEIDSELVEYLNKAQVSWDSWVKEIKFLIKAHAYALKVNYNDDCYQELVGTMISMMNRDAKIKNITFNTSSYNNDIITEIKEKITQFEKVAISVEEAYKLTALIEKYNNKVEVDQSYFNDIWSNAVRTIDNELATCYSLSTEVFMNNLFYIESQLSDTVRSNIRRYWNVQWLESTERYGVARQINENDEVYITNNPAEIRSRLDKEMISIGIDTSN